MRAVIESNAPCVLLHTHQELDINKVRLQKGTSKREKSAFSLITWVQ